MQVKASWKTIPEWSIACRSPLSGVHPSRAQYPAEAPVPPIYTEEWLAALCWGATASACTDARKSPIIKFWDRKLNAVECLELSYYEMFNLNRICRSITQ